jgi:hypothetical protein
MGWLTAGGLQLPFGVALCCTYTNENAVKKETDNFKGRKQGRAD